MRILTLIMFSILLTGCASSEPEKPYDPEAEMAKNTARAAAKIKAKDDALKRTEGWIAGAPAREKAYAELAANMRDHGNADAATAFDRLIGEGREHQQRLAEWAVLEGLEIDEATGMQMMRKEITLNFEQKLQLRIAKERGIPISSLKND